MKTNLVCLTAIGLLTFGIANSATAVQPVMPLPTYENLPLDFSSTPTEPFYAQQETEAPSHFTTPDITSEAMKGTLKDAAIGGIAALVAGLFWKNRRSK